MADDSRVEEILKSKMNNTSYNKRPLSRVEELLINLDTYIDESHQAILPSDSSDVDEADLDDIMSVISTDNDD